MLTLWHKPACLAQLALQMAPASRTLQASSLAATTGEQASASI